MIYARSFLKREASRNARSAKVFTNGLFSEPFGIVKSGQGLILNIEADGRVFSIIMQDDQAKQLVSFVKEVFNSAS